MAGQAEDGTCRSGLEAWRQGPAKGTFARRTGQSGRSGVAFVVATGGWALLLLDAASRSPWGAYLSISPDTGTILGFLSPFVVLAGMALRWWGIRCPQCHAAVYWRHLSSQSIFRKDTSDPDRYGCADCGYGSRQSVETSKRVVAQGKEADER
jgi:hypothetical protein